MRRRVSALQQISRCATHAGERGLGCSDMTLRELTGYQIAELQALASANV